MKRKIAQDIVKVSTELRRVPTKEEYLEKGNYSKEIENYIWEYLIDYCEFGDYDSSTKILMLNDIHIPFEDKPCVELAFKFIADWKPHRIILNGDIIDGEYISKFLKRPDRAQTLEEEHIKGNAFLDRLDEVCDKIGNVKKVFLEGNHEARLENYIMKEASALMGLYNLDSFLNLKERGYEHLVCGQPYKVPEANLYYVHGLSVSKHSGYTAKNHFEKLGVSTNIGHTHRVGVHHKRNLIGTFQGVEGGCLCDLNAGYMVKNGIADWQHAITTTRIFSENEFCTTPNLIYSNGDERKMFCEGKIYKV